MKIIYKISFFFLFLLVSVVFSQDGTVKLYYDDGKIKAELNYVNDVLNGFSTWYYHNGNKQKEVYYSDGKIDGRVRYFYENGLIKAEFEVKDGIRDGLTKLYYPNGGLKEVKIFDKGKLIKTVKVGYDSSFVAPLERYAGAIKQLEKRKRQNDFLCEVDQCPEPIGGLEAIQRKIIYPPKAKMYGLEGKVILKATVDAKGNVKKVQVIQGLGLGCTEAAIKAVKNTKFLPAEDKGKTVEAWVSLTIQFKLSNKKEKIAARPPEKIETPEAVDLAEITPRQQIQHAETKHISQKAIRLSSDSLKKNLVSASRKETVQQTPHAIQKNKIAILSCNADICPQPIGGIEAIKKNLVVPHKVKQLKLEGDVVVLTTIDEFGNVRDTHVIQKLGHGCDEAAEVAILDTRFKPGKKNGRRTRCNVKILIPFSYRE